MKNNKFFIKNGYCIINLFSKREIEILKNNIKKKLNTLARKIGYNLELKDIEKYHKIDISNEIHNKLLSGKTRYILLEKRILKKIILNKKILSILKETWGHAKCSVKFIFSSKKKMLDNTTGFRIARPKKMDFKDVGGEHLDLHYGGIYNYNHKILYTIWCPLVGFNEKYTLRISSKSHLKKHSVKFISNQNKYVSPVFKKSYAKKFKFFRPRLKSGQAIIFHPNLLHGRSSNFGNKTRVSIDLRIFNKGL